MFKLASEAAGREAGKTWAHYIFRTGGFIYQPEPDGPAQTQ